MGLLSVTALKVTEYMYFDSEHIKSVIHSLNIYIVLSFQ